MFPEGGLRKCEEVGRVDAHGVTTEVLLSPSLCLTAVQHGGGETGITGRWSLVSR